MKMFILLAVGAVLVVVMVIFYALIMLAICCYFMYKALKMTDMELIKAQIEELEEGWFHNLKYEIYHKEFERRPRIILPPDVD